MTDSSGRDGDREQDPREADGDRKKASRTGRNLPAGQPVLPKPAGPAETGRPTPAGRKRSAGRSETTGRPAGPAETCRK